MISHSISLWPLCSELARHLGMLRTVSFIHLHLFNLDLSFSPSLPFSSLKRPQKKKISWIWSTPSSLYFYCIGKVLVKTLPMPLHILNDIIETILTVSIKLSFSGLFQAESEWRGGCSGSCNMTAHMLYLEGNRIWVTVFASSTFYTCTCILFKQSMCACKIWAILALVPGNSDIDGCLVDMEKFAYKRRRSVQKCCSPDCVTDAEVRESGVKGFPHCYQRSSVQSWNCLLGLLSLNPMPYLLLQPCSASMHQAGKQGFHICLSSTVIEIRSRISRNRKLPDKFQTISLKLVIVCPPVSLDI